MLAYPPRPMSIRLHDTLTRKKTAFSPRVAGQASMYLCGPTVYDDCHIGHLMGPVVFDAVARWLRARDLEVRFVVNITDIDDKIIRRAKENNEDWKGLAERYTQQYFGFLRRLQVRSVTDHPRCTDYVAKMVEFTSELIAQDRAYETQDGVYFDVRKQSGYGKLSGRKLDEMRSGERVTAASDLRHAADFALWKKAKPGEPTWPSPWGEGRPGWHLECSVMSSELLGPEFDIHCGGDDLKFPHHENEIAQSEAHGDAYAKYWMHHGLVQFGGKKIAKSDPRMQDPEFSNQFQASWLLDRYGAATLRFFLLRGHYRRPIDFEPKNLDATATALTRLHDQLGELLSEEDDATLAQIEARIGSGPLRDRLETFTASMDDDFGTGEAVAVLFSLAQDARKNDGADAAAALLLMRDLGRLLGIFTVADGEERESRERASGGEGFKVVADGLVQLLLELRNEARGSKDFTTADRIRDGLAALDVALEDGTDGTTWTLPKADR